MLFFGAVVALAAAVAAIPAPQIVTNGERLARRLPPLPPKFGRELPGYARSLDDPTPVYLAPRGKPSALPVTYTGLIEVRHDGSKVGYVDDKFGVDDKKDLHVSFTTTGTGVFNIRATKHKSKGPHFLGGFWDTPVSLGAGSAAIVDVTGVKETRRGVPPTHEGKGYGESAIWSFDSSTKQISAHWVNTDGSKSPTTIAWDAETSTIFLTGDLAAYNKGDPHPASAVTFYLANDS